MNAVMTTIEGLVQSARLAEECKHSVRWCLGKMPELYTSFFATFESRFREEILRLEQAVLKQVTKEDKKLAANLKEQFQGLHLALGFQGTEKSVA